MFLIGSPGREVNILRVEAAEAPQLVMKARTLPSQETAYHLAVTLANYSQLLTYSLSIQAGRRTRFCGLVAQEGARNRTPTGHAASSAGQLRRELS